MLDAVPTLPLWAGSPGVPAGQDGQAEQKRVSSLHAFAPLAADAVDSEARPQGYSQALCDEPLVPRDHSLQHEHSRHHRRGLFSRAVLGVSGLRDELKPTRTTANYELWHRRWDSAGHLYEASQWSQSMHRKYLPRGGRP